MTVARRRRPRRKQRRKQRRMLMLLLPVLVVLAAEGLARKLHDKRDADFFFDRYFFDTRLADARRDAPDAPPGPVPVGQVPATAEGFRGTFLIDAPRGLDQLRVVATGAGHLYAQDVPWGLAWTERVEAALNQSGLPAQVWNVAVPGSTVLFVERDQLDAILAADPQVVVLGHGGFNEALFAGVPEAAILHPRRPLLNLVLSSQLVRLGLLRGGRALRWLGGHEPTNKVPLPTFRKSLNAVLDRLNKAGVHTILVQQVVVNPDIPGVWKLAEMAAYRRAVADIAHERSIVVVDPADVFVPPEDRWFERKEYYSADAHAAIAAQVLPHLQTALTKPDDAR